MTNPKTLLKIQIFYIKLQAGQINNPYDLAVALEKLADLAWDEVDELYRNSLLP